MYKTSIKGICERSRKPWKRMSGDPIIDWLLAQAAVVHFYCESRCACLSKIASPPNNIIFLADSFPGACVFWKTLWLFSAETSFVWPFCCCPNKCIHSPSRAEKTQRPENDTRQIFHPERKLFTLLNISAQWCAHLEFRSHTDRTHKMEMQPGPRRDAKNDVFSNPTLEWERDAKSQFDDGGEELILLLERRGNTFAERVCEPHANLLSTRG